MDIAALNNKHIELLLSRGIKTTKFVETSDPKVRDRLEKEISELDKEIKVYEDAIAKETRRMNENGAKSTATFDRVHQQMKNANPVHSQNYSEFFKDIKRPTPISGGGGCLGAFCSTNNATKNVINVSKMNVNEIVEKIKGLLLKVFAIGTAPEQKKQHMAEVSVYMNELNKQSKSTVPATREAAIAAIKMKRVRKNSDVDTMRYKR